MINPIEEIIVTVPELSGVRLSLDETNGVAIFELNAPRKLNAISGAVLDDLITAMDWVEAAGARAVLVRGAGTAFSAGADFESYLEEVDVTDPASADDFLDRWVAVFRRLRGLSLPTVAGLHGVAYGGGLNLALACDLVMAGRSTRMCEPYVRIGATADVGASWMLPQLVGMARARRLLITGEPINAVEAHAMGLIAYLVDDDDLPAESLALAGRMAALDPAAVRANRALLLQDEPSSLEQALAREKQSNHDRVATPEFAQSISRFRK